MPIVSNFYGIIIYFFFNEHNPPHFHAKYNEFEALIDIKTLGVSKGKLPSKALSLIVEWASNHQEELMNNWELCRNDKTPNKIAPLN